METERARQLLIEQEGRLAEIRSGTSVETDEQTLGEDAAGQHPADAGSDTEAVSRELGQLEDIEAELREVEEALARLDAGTYGICEVCGKPIPDERLEAVPTARYHVEHEPTDRL
jgi:RNA polymerase-binding transcription factor